MLRSNPRDGGRKGRHRQESGGYERIPEGAEEDTCKKSREDPPRIRTNPKAHFGSLLIQDPLLDLD